LLLLTYIGRPFILEITNMSFKVVLSKNVYTNVYIDGI